MIKTYSAGWFSSESRYHQTKVSIESFHRFHGPGQWEYYLLFCGSIRELSRLSIPPYVKVVFLSQMNPLYVENADKIGLIGGFPRPLLADYMFNAGHGVAMLFDGDTEFFNGVWQEVYELDDTKFNAIVTPHRITPPPLDGKRVCQELFALYGNYNAGFVGLANTAETRSFLDWWMTISLMADKIDFANGRCSEQGWLRFIADYLPKVNILRDQGVNFAFWRWDREDMLEKRGGHWYVDGQPLRMFHYSHFDPNDLPASIERHQNRAKCSPLMVEFLQRYKERIQS